MTAAPMTITLVVGSYPPERCGVGDHTAKLAAALAAQGHHVGVQVSPRRGTFRSTLRTLRRSPVVHLEYPSVGAGASLTPLIELALARRRAVVTVHEYSLAHPLRKATIVALTMVARRTIVVTDVELAALPKFVLRLRRPTVVPIGATVPTIPEVAAAPERDLDVAYFGLLGPGKGLELFVELMRTARQRRVPIRAAIAGATTAQHQDFDDRMHALATELDVDWHGDIAPEVVGALLARSRFAYLPYPDGASERRSSLLAAAGNGVVVITNDGVGVTPALRAAVLIADTPSAALDIISGTDDAKWQAQSKAGIEYAEQRSWDAIATQTVHVYESLRMRRPSPSAQPADAMVAQ